MFTLKELQIIDEAVFDWQQGCTENGPFSEAVIILDKVNYLKDIIRESK